MGKDKRYSTRWWVASWDDASQIATYFHGPGKPGHYNFEEYRDMIADAIVGEPKKLVLGMLEYFMTIEADHVEELSSEYGVVETFVAARAWDAWARNNGKGRWRAQKEEVA